MRFLGFLATILLLTALSWLLVGTFIHDLIPGGWRTAIIAWAVSVAPLFLLIRNIATGRYPSAIVRLFAFRLFWYAQLLMLPLALASAAAALLALPFGAANAAGRAVVLVLAPLFVLLGLWGYVGSRRLVVRQVPLAPRGLPAALDGLKIVQLSDLHVGPQTSRKQLAKIAAATRDAKPHIIAYTGDQVDDYPHDVDDLASAFGDLTAPLGVYAIAGNHDVYAGWSEVRRALEAMGVTVLVNRAVKLEYNGASFWLAGTGDPAGAQFVRGDETGAPDIARTLADVPRGAFCIVLAHNPALFPSLAARGVPVVLSGHTHYGQFSFPSKGWSLASVFLEYAMGTYERNGSLLYISPGTNYWGIPFRIGALPEVTVVTLESR
ncbi:MAG TPA: metallophosphoesterase [Gemmatimonadaceae bacterium]